MEDLGSKLKELRKKIGLTQKEMAEKVGVARSTYALYETNKIKPSLDVYNRIVELTELETFESGADFDEAWKRLTSGEKLPITKTAEEISLENLETNITEKIVELNSSGLFRVQNYVEDLISTGNYKRDKKFN